MTDIPAVDSIHHLALTVTDADASIAWYQRVFGLVRLGEYTHPDGGGYGVVLVHPQSPFGVVIHHHDANEREPFAERRTGLDHAAFHVPDREQLEAWQRRFEELDVVHSPITAMPDVNALVLVLRDPDNIQLELFTEG